MNSYPADTESYIEKVSKTPLAEYLQLPRQVKLDCMYQIENIRSGALGSVGCTTTQQTDDERIREFDSYFKATDTVFDSGTLVMQMGIRVTVYSLTQVVPPHAMIH